MEGQNNTYSTSCLSEFAFYFNLGKSVLDLDVIYVRSIISFSCFLGSTPRCVPCPGAESMPARLIDNLPLTAALITPALRFSQLRGVDILWVRQRSRRPISRPLTQVSSEPHAVQRAGFTLPLEESALDRETTRLGKMQGKVEL